MFCGGVVCVICDVFCDGMFLCGVVGVVSGAKWSLELVSGTCLWNLSLELVSGNGPLSRMVSGTGLLN